MVIWTTWFLPPGAGAWTVFPFIFCSDFRLLPHEWVHWHQQARWALYGLGVGLIVWWLLYLIFLPVWWNPFRDRWEREAMKTADGFDDVEIDFILSKPPYYLWSLTNHRILR